MDDDKVQAIGSGAKPTRTKDSLVKAIENELSEARLKEFRNKLKQLVVDRDAARKVLLAKEAEIDALADDYADVIPA